MDLDGAGVASWPGPDDTELQDASVGELLREMRKELRRLKRNLYGVLAVKAAFYGTIWVAAIKVLVGA